jgi:hypothetical protein
VTWQVDPVRWGWWARRVSLASDVDPQTRSNPAMSAMLLISLGLVRLGLVSLGLVGLEPCHLRLRQWSFRNRLVGEVWLMPRVVAHTVVAHRVLIHELPALHKWPALHELPALTVAKFGLVFVRRMLLAPGRMALRRPETEIRSSAIWWESRIRVERLMA